MRPGFVRNTVIVLGIGLRIGILTGIFSQWSDYRNSAGWLLLREKSKLHCW